MSKKKRGRGRPPKFTGEERKQIVNLLRDQKNAVRTREILLSRNGVVGVSKKMQEDAKVRKAFGFDKPYSISMPSLLKIAKQARIRLQRGRPKLEKVAA